MSASIVARQANDCLNRMSRQMRVDLGFEAVETKSSDRVAVPHQNPIREEVQAESTKAATAAVSAAFLMFKHFGAFDRDPRVWIKRSLIEHQIRRCYSGPIRIDECAEFLLKEICTEEFHYINDGDPCRYCQLTEKGLHLLRDNASNLA